MEPSRFSNALHRPRAGPLQGVLAGLRGLPGARTKKAHVGRNCTVSTADVALGMEPSRFSKCCFLVTPSREWPRDQMIVSLRRAPPCMMQPLGEDIGV